MMTDYSNLTDNELQSLAVSDDRAAEEELASRYMRMVKALSRPLFLAGGDSEDLIQEGTFGLLSAIRQFDPSVDASFKTYAEHCIRMRLYSAVRSASRLKHFPLNNGMSLEQLQEQTELQLSAYPELPLSNPEEMVLARERKEELYSAFSESLSALEIDVLELYLDGYSYHEIAQRLHKNDKAVDNAVQRIRRKLSRNPNIGVISAS